MFASAGPAPSTLLQPAVAVVAPPASVASEPLFLDIVARAKDLKAAAEAFRRGAGMEGAALTLTGFDGFKARITELSGQDLQGHLLLKQRGTDGDLKCILRGISQDLPLRLADIEAARTAVAQGAALDEMIYLLNDNVEVITSPPKPAV
jgi:hypothetical protein